MATWEDGPEYAPIERPQNFAMPEVAPLDQAAPYVQVAAGAPVDRPQFTGPQDPVQPLASIGPDDGGEQRDPHTPFETVESTVTGGSTGAGLATTTATASPNQSAWGSAHWSPPTGPPVQPPPPHAQQQPQQNWPTPDGYPAPGTPQWFGPGAGTPTAQQGQAGPPDARRVLDAVTPGVAICLVVGGLIYLLAPLMLIIAFVLSGRVKVAKPRVRLAFIIASSALGFFALVGLFTNNLSFGDWWGFIGMWALVLCWGMLITLPVLIFNELKKGVSRPFSPPPPPQNWG